MVDPRITLKRMQIADHRWRAAMSGAAVNDWIGYGDMTDAKDFTPSFIGPSPWISDKMRALYEAESPLSDAAAVTTPKPIDCTTMLATTMAQQTPSRSRVFTLSGTHLRGR